VLFFKEKLEKIAKNKGVIMKTYHALCQNTFKKPNDGTNEDLLVMPQLCPREGGRPINLEPISPFSARALRVADE
jgi:hypothetical protein